MANIKTVKKKNKETNKFDTYYCAKDVAEASGVLWHSRKLFPGVDQTQVAEHTIEYKSDSGKKCNARQIFLTGKGVTQFCEKYGVESPIAVTKPTSSSSAISLAKFTDLENTLAGLKKMVANLAIKDKNESEGKVISLTTDPVNVKVDVSPVIQAQARKEIRKILEDYALAWAAKENANTPADKNIYFDLTWNSLYSEFNKRNSIDLKKLAQERSANGTKVTALQTAELTGNAVALLKLAKQLF